MQIAFGWDTSRIATGNKMLFLMIHVLFCPSRNETRLSTGAAKSGLFFDIVYYPEILKPSYH